MSLTGIACRHDLRAKSSIRSKPPSGSAGRIRTYDQPINSRLLYH